jgi:hypothetical protein
VTGYAIVIIGAVVIALEFRYLLNRNNDVWR